jgi:hypothetical protein
MVALASKFHDLQFRQGMCLMYIGMIQISSGVGFLERTVVYIFFSVSSPYKTPVRGLLKKYNVKGKKRSYGRRIGDSDQITFALKMPEKSKPETPSLRTPGSIQVRTKSLSEPHERK